MTAIEATIKALMEFEEELERIRAEVTESKKKLVKNAAEWAQSAMTKAISDAKLRADTKVAKARAEAEKEASSIMARGEMETRSFESMISSRSEEAVQLVLKRLLQT